MLQEQLSVLQDFAIWTTLDNVKDTKDSAVKLIIVDELESLVPVAQLVSSH